MIDAADIQPRGIERLEVRKPMDRARFESAGAGDF